MSASHESARPPCGRWHSRRHGWRTAVERAGVPGLGLSALLLLAVLRASHGAGRRHAPRARLPAPGWHAAHGEVPEHIPPGQCVVVAITPATSTASCSRRRCRTLRLRHQARDGHVPLAGVGSGGLGSEFVERFIASAAPRMRPGACATPAPGHSLVFFPEALSRAPRAC